ncbi:MAG: alanine racemase, partial [Candidatus Sumerlaeota bacterium]|nr:alanine racemase [Candidatus Sumerlaeota bacterium]
IDPNDPTPIRFQGELQRHEIGDWTEARALFDLAETLDGVQLEGLMAMAPLVEDLEQARPTFQGLRRLRDQLLDAGVRPERLRELSMGMSSDFEVAVEEGATLVRIGSALFRGVADSEGSQGT